MSRRAATMLKALLASAVVLAGVAACSAEQVAAGFRSFCRHAQSCDDYSRRSP
jgi:hypothetical protein